MVTERDERAVRVRRRRVRRLAVAGLDRPRGCLVAAQSLLLALAIYGSTCVVRGMKGISGI